MPDTRFGSALISTLTRWGAERYAWRLWLIPIVLISPAALLIPADVFVQYPWAKTYAHWLAKLIPMIDRAANLHPHHDQFRAFFAYAWSWLPLCVFLAWYDGRGRQVAALKAGWESPALFFAMLFFAYIVALLWHVPASPWFGNTPMRQYDRRLGLYQSTFTWIWFGPFQTYTTAIIGVGIFRYARVLWINRPIYDIGPK